MAPWKALIRLAGAQVWLVPVLIVLALTATAAEGMGLGLLVFLLELMLGTPGESVGGSGFLDRTYKAMFSLVGEDVLIVAAVTVSLIMLKSLLVAGYQCLSGAMNATVSDRLRRLVFRRLMDADYALVSGRDHGHFQNLITSESLRATEALLTVSQMLVNLCAIAVFVVMLLLISWKLVLVMAFGTLAAYLVSMLLARKAKTIGESFTKIYSAMAGRVASVLGGMRMVRAFGREQDEIGRFEGFSEALRRRFLHVQYLKAATGPVSEMLYLGVFVGIVAISTQAGLPLTSVITFVVVLGRLQPHVKDLHWCRVQLSGLRAAVEGIMEFLRHPPAAVMDSGSVLFDGLKHCIRFANVSFAYKGDRNPALQQISFGIPRAKTTAIVGGSGAGKSTIVNLILRLYAPTSGRIAVDGRSIAEFDLASWRARLAVAGQDADLIEGTVLENLAYGCPSASLDDVEQAATKAGILDFIRELPDGWNTRVGERGVRLSGGQRQRLGLARALLRQADVLILDEATNALDGLLEAEIKEAIRAMAGSTTIVVIAHKLSTVLAADHVVVLRDGSIEEQGTPDELVARPSHFRKLYSNDGVLAEKPARTETSLNA